MDRVFRDYVDEVRAEGRTILLSSHILSEVEALCDRVSIIRAGRTVESGSMAQLRHLTRTSVAVTLERPPALSMLAAIPGVHDVALDGPRVTLSADTGGARHTGPHLPATHLGGAVHAQLRVMTASLAGTATLARLAVRRDRVLLPVGILGIALFAISSAKATLALYPSAASMEEGIKTIFASPAAVALYGPISDPTDPNALAVVKTTMFGAVLLAIFGYAVVRRHTRSEEEDGRFELVGAGVVGRRAPLVVLAKVGDLARFVDGLNGQAQRLQFLHQHLE
jgi:hypothetical protein